MDSGTVGCSGRSDFSLLVNVAQYVGREGSQVTPPSSYNINHLKGGTGLPLRGGNSIMVWAFCHAPLLINSERIFVLNLFRVICGHLKVHGRTLFVIIQFLFPFAKSYLDGLCVSLTGRNAGLGLCWCCLSGCAFGDKEYRVRLHYRGAESKAAENRP